MNDPDERLASLALRDGGPAPLRRAIEWYRAHDRLHCGDPITMAADALAAHQADSAAGKDALLVCDTTEIADALNQRIYHDTVGPDKPTVSGARGHRRAVGDLIISRQSDVTIPLRNPDDPAAEQNPVRNGNRWRVTAINSDNNRLVARRLDDRTLAAFSSDYVREQITHGYAVTVHSAQGVTADTTHAMLGEHATRNLLYVALTRGRDNNTAYLYERTVGDTDHGRSGPGDTHLTSRGTSADAAGLIRAILANHDQTQSPPATTPHKYPAQRYPAVSNRFSTSERQLCTGVEQLMRCGAPKQRDKHSQ
jgi:hypothetical protein